MRPRARMSTIAARASRTKRAAEYASVGSDDVEQVVRDARALGGVGLRGADVHAAVDLRGVDRDDLAAEALGERERERALARRGRTHQENGGQHGAARRPISGRA